MNRQQRLEQLNRTLDETATKADAARRGVSRVAPSESTTPTAAANAAGGPDLRKLQRSQDATVATLKRMEQRDKARPSFAVATRRLGL